MIVKEGNVYEKTIICKDKLTTSCYLLKKDLFTSNEHPNIPDINFRKLIWEQVLKKTKKEYQSNFPISISDLTNIKTCTKLELIDTEIENTAGLEYFESLVTLYINKNKKQIMLDTSNNEKLKVVNILRSPIEKLDFSKNKALESLYIYNNNLLELDISNNEALTFLIISNNQLTEIDVSNNKKLRHLIASNNCLESLNLSENKALELLSLDRNELKTLDLSKNEELEYLFVYNNNLSSLDVSNNKKLIYLNCENNQLVSLGIKANANKALKELYCKFNKLEILELSGLNICHCSASNQRIT